MARIAAVTDSLSTQFAFNMGFSEKNPVFGTHISPIGLVGVAAYKFGFLELVDHAHITPAEKFKLKQKAAALWTGVTVNNILVALSATHPVPLLIGFLTGCALWDKEYSDTVVDTDLKPM